MDDILHINVENAPKEHVKDHGNYEFYMRSLAPLYSKDCTVTHYEIPPGKSNYPYHYHMQNEESFYILSGKGLLKTPKGDITVSAGDYIFFPPNENGAHKLTNISETENLSYLDFDTESAVEVSFYPDSKKVGIWGKKVNMLYKTEQSVDYYEGE